MKHFFKKIAMTVAMLLSFLQASAYDFEANGIYFNITDATKHEVAVTYKAAEGKSYSGDINIPPTVTHEGTTYSVTSIGAYAFFSCHYLTSITIPNSVTSIGEWAFMGCLGLTSVNIPNSVTTIGDSAFQWCTGLTSITIPSSVTAIGACAFADCRGLIEINVDTENRIYASVEGVIYNKTLTEIILYPGGKTETTFSIPNSVTTIGRVAFYDCSNLTSVTIPNSVTSIGEGAFSGCEGLTSMTIPSSVTSIGEHAFIICTGLIEIKVDAANRFYASVEGVLFNKNITEIIRYPEGKTGSNFSIPNSVTYIGIGAFSGCLGLTRVTIPNSVTAIGEGAFNGCLNLTSVTIPNSVTAIGVAAFASCYGLTSVIIPNSVTSIEDWAFGNCKNLTSVIIPSSVASIGNIVFSSCPIKSLYCHWEEPLRCSDDLFSSKCYDEATLYVPKGCTDNYKATSPWSKFWNIEELDNLGVEDIIENQLAGCYVVYDLQGVLRLKTENIDEVKRLPAGLYIVNGKKILIR